MKRAMSLGCISFLLLAASSAPGQTAELAVGTAVRVQSRALSSGWNEGTFAPDAGCPSVSLKQPTHAGRTKILVSAVERMQRNRGNRWEDVELKALLVGTPSRCRETPKKADEKPVH